MVDTQTTPTSTEVMQNIFQPVEETPQNQQVVAPDVVQSARDTAVKLGSSSAESTQVDAVVEQIERNQALLTPDQTFGLEYFQEGNFTLDELQDFLALQEAELENVVANQQHADADPELSSEIFKDQATQQFLDVWYGDGTETNPGQLKQLLQQLDLPKQQENGEPLSIDDFFKGLRGQMLEDTERAYRAAHGGGKLSEEEEGALTTKLEEEEKKFDERKKTLEDRISDAFGDAADFMLMNNNIETLMDFLFTSSAYNRLAPEKYKNREQEGHREITIHDLTKEMQWSARGNSADRKEVWIEEHKKIAAQLGIDEAEGWDAKTTDTSQIQTWMEEIYKKMVVLEPAQVDRAYQELFDAFDHNHYVGEGLVSHYRQLAKRQDIFKEFFGEK